MTTRRQKNKPPPIARSAVEQVVETYLRVEERQMSAYWPIVEQIRTMLDIQQPPKTIRQAFKKAYVKLYKGCGDSKPYRLTAFQKRVGEAMKVAQMGKEQLEVFARQKVGFYAALAQAKDKERPQVEPEVEAERSEEEASCARPGASKVEADDEAAEQRSKELLIDVKWQIENEPEEFLHLISSLIEERLLPEAIMPLIKEYLNERVNTEGNEAHP